MPNADETMALLRSKFRTPIIAEIGGFRPPDDPRASWFGAGCARLGESIPVEDGEPMFPLLQINTAELPGRVPAFGDTKLLVVYISNAGIPFDRPHGDGWEIREYDSLEGLVPISSSMPDHLKPLPIRWLNGEPERPGWEESWSLLDMGPISSSKAHFDQFFDLPHHYRTKIGGYPSEVQHEVDHAPEFVFQIGSEEKPQWMWVDDGVAYFSRSPSNEWQLEVQFF